LISASPPDVRRWLSPAVELAFLKLGYALVLQLKGNAQTKGIARSLNEASTAGLSHPLTSGGEAETIVFDYR
jgi:hypothetical protein